MSDNTSDGDAHNVSMMKGKGRIALNVGCNVLGDEQTQHHTYWALQAEAEVTKTERALVRSTLSLKERELQLVATLDELEWLKNALSESNFKLSALCAANNALR